MSEARELVLDRLRAGQDALVVGTRASIKSVLADTAAGLADEARALSVSAPPGGLTLSGLMAQVSGRVELGEHDDAVLEEVFRLLSGAGAPAERTILLIDACAGLQRTALQYLNHAGRTAPRLRLVIGAEAVPAELQEAPGLNGLRARLLGAGSIMVAPADGAPHPVPMAPSAPIAVPMAPVAVPAGPIALAMPPRWRSVTRKLSGAAVAGGMAASLAIGVLVGHATAPTSGSAKLRPSSLAEAAVPRPSAPGSAAPLVAAVAPAVPPAVTPSPVLAMASAPEPEPVPAAPLVAGGPPDRVDVADAPVVSVPSAAIASLQAGEADADWSAAKLLNDRDPGHRGHLPLPPHPRLPASAGASGEQPDAGPLLSPAEVARVRRHFEQHAGWRRARDWPPPYPAWDPSRYGAPEPWGEDAQGD